MKDQELEALARKFCNSYDIDANEMWIKPDNNRFGVKSYSLIWLMTAFHKQLSNKWISVEDDLPKQHDIFVLGFTSEKWIEKVYFSGVNFYPSQDRAGEVTHWQPLPEPPQ